MSAQVVFRFEEDRVIELVGWLTCDLIYEEDIEIWADGIDLGDSRDVLGELQAFAGKRVRIVIEAVDDPGEASNTRNSPDRMA